jgi:hypothetical protein
MFLICLIFFCCGVHAEGLEETSANVNISLKVEFPELAGLLPTLNFTETAEIFYYLGDHHIEIDAEDIPKLYYEVGENPLYENLTMIVEVLKDTTISAEWTDEPTITAIDVNLVVSAYPLTKDEVNETSIPVLSAVFRDIEMTSGKIEYDGFSLEGIVDPDSLSTTLVFIEEFPITGMDAIDNVMVGSVVLGELTLQIANPYEK